MCLLCLTRSQEELGKRLSVRQEVSGITIGTDEKVKLGEMSSEMSATDQDWLRTDSNWDIFSHIQGSDTRSAWQTCIWLCIIIRSSRGLSTTSLYPSHLKFHGKGVTILGTQKTAEHCSKGAKVTCLKPQVLHRSTSSQFERFFCPGNHDDDSNCRLLLLSSYPSLIRKWNYSSWRHHFPCQTYFPGDNKHFSSSWLFLYSVLHPPNDSTPAWLNASQVSLSLVPVIRCLNPAAHIPDVSVWIMIRVSGDTFWNSIDHPDSMIWVQSNGLSRCVFCSSSFSSTSRFGRELKVLERYETLWLQPQLWVTFSSDMLFSFSFSSFPDPKAVWITALAPYFVLFALLVQGVQLEGSSEGIKYYLSPQWDKLLEIDVRRSAWSPSPIID